MEMKQQALTLMCDVLKAVVNLSLEALKVEDVDLYNSLMKIHDDIVTTHLPSLYSNKQNSQE